ncbi:MAG: hypothetical protein GXO68_03120 [Crenarchaeota archaeon]|nr:hypothetical protein [Thermoproteota archaeon]
MLPFTLQFNPYPFDLYSLAIYIIFPLSIIIFIVGFAYRITRLILALRRKKWVAYRAPVGITTLILGLVNVYIYPPLFAAFRNKKDLVLGLMAVHMVGLLPLIFLLGQHVAFYAYFIPIYSLLWPLAIPISAATGSLPLFQQFEPAIATQPFHSSIWGPLTVVLNGDVLTIISLVAVGFKLGERLYMMVKEGHRPSDVILYIHLTLILITGALAAHHESLPFLTGASAYRSVLGLHMILAGLFLALVPFTKYWHFVFGMFFGKIVEWIDRTVMRGAALEGGRLVPPRRKVRRR